MEDLKQVDRGWSLEKFELNQGIGIDAITDSQLCCFNEVPLYWVRNYFKGLQLATIISLSEDAIFMKVKRVIIFKRLLSYFQVEYNNKLYGFY